MSKTGFLCLCLWAAVLSGLSAEIHQLFPGDSIQETLERARPGDTIILAPGLYEENIIITMSVTLKSRGTGERENTRLQGKGNAPVITIKGGAPVIEGLTITGGGGEKGGGILGKGSHGTVRNNIIRDNSVTRDGGGISGINGPVTGNIITGNTAFNKGGGISNCHGPVTGNRIHHNRALNYDGGGIYYAEGEISNNLIYANTAGRWGGGLYYSTGKLLHNTIWENNARVGGGIKYAKGTILNNIIWANRAEEKEDQISYSARPRFNCIEGGEETGNNINTPPELTAPETGDFTLKSGSPCIDRGTKEDNCLTDILGQVRRYPDLGAFEYRAPGGIKLIPGGAETFILDEEGNLFTWGKAGTLPYPKALELPGKIKDMVSGNAHHLALTEEGTVLAWGDNTYGQLGVSGEHGVPAKIPGLKQIALIGAGAYHSAAVTGEGTLYLWGKNNKGQLIPGREQVILLPEKIEDLPGITAISGGEEHTLFLSREGIVLTRGTNARGQLGTGEAGAREGRVILPSPVTSISAGKYHSLALTETGELYTWGSNDYGQTGNPGPPGVPWLAAAETTIASAGGYHTVFLSRGDLMAMGRGDRGQNGSTSHLYFPGKIPFDGEIAALACGENGTLILTFQGVPWGVGEYLPGREGSYIPSKIPAREDIIALGAGRNHALALRADGGLLYFENTGYGEREVNLFPDLHGITLIAAGGNQSLALDTRGQLFAWETGNLTPRLISCPEKITAIEAGESHALFLTEKGNLYSWGDNRRGQLGTGDYLSSSTPRLLNTEEKIISIAAGKNHNLARTESLMILTWGSNEQGELGDGTTDESPRPRKLDGLKWIKGITAGSGNSGALNLGGNLYLWGLPRGNGTGEITLMPEVTEIYNPLDVKTGENFILVLNHDGTLEGWGCNSQGQLATGDRSDRYCPTPGGPDKIIALEAGQDYILALENDRTIRFWGRGMNPVKVPLP